jgi:hypothetical protein
LSYFARRGGPKVATAPPLPHPVGAWNLGHNTGGGEAMARRTLGNGVTSLVQNREERRVHRFFVETGSHLYGQVSVFVWYEQFCTPSYRI